MSVNPREAAQRKRSKFRDAADPDPPEHNADITMKFTLWWKHPGEDKEQDETYEKITADPEKWSREIIDWFNSTRRPHERERVFVRCLVAGEVPPAEHKWSKATAMTQMDARIRSGSPFDRMQCERCGVTGKRYGLQQRVKIDSKFKLKVYQRCDTSCAARGTPIIPGKGKTDAED